jgi:hypothetical protein
MFLCMNYVTEMNFKTFFESNSVCFSYSKEMNICLLELHIPFELGPGLLCSRAIFYHYTLIVYIRHEKISYRKNPCCGGFLSSKRILI